MKEARDRLASVTLISLGKEGFITIEVTQKDPKFAAALAKKEGGGDLSPADLDFPGVEDGLSGVRFIDRCVESSRKGPAWVEF